jgi:hypothetical protein
VEKPCLEGWRLSCDISKTGDGYDHSPSQVILIRPDALMEYIQHGPFQQPAQIALVLYILINCLRPTHARTSVVDPRPISIPQPCVFAHLQAKTESFAAHTCLASESSLYNLVAIESSFSPMHYSAILLGTNRQSHPNFYESYKDDECTLTRSDLAQYLGQQGLFSCMSQSSLLKQRRCNRLVRRCLMARLL